VLTGSDNFTIGGMTNYARQWHRRRSWCDDHYRNAPDVVGYTSRLIAFDFEPGVCRHGALSRPWHSAARLLFANALSDVSSYIPG